MSVRTTKVKGHATQKMVDEGEVKEADKEGNDQADTAAAADAESAGKTKIN